MPEINEEQMRAVAAQLRKPQGEHANEIAQRMNEANAHLYRCAIEAIKIQSGDLVVEVGMGNGRFVPMILSEGTAVRYVGCDYSEEMVSAANELNNPTVSEGTTTFHCTTADALPLRDREADILFTINTIYFWDDPYAVLSEFRRVLKDNGRLLIGLRPRRSMEKYPFTQFGFKMYSRDELVTLLSGSGFNLTEVIEKEEPGQQIDGDVLVVESLIAVCTKSK